MRITPFRVVSGLSLACALLACSSGEDSQHSSNGADSSYECTDDSACAPGSECSGGACVAVQLCTSDAACGSGAICDAGKCRAYCADVTDCSSSGLTCDLSVNLCMPIENPSTTSGSGGASSDGSGGTTSGSGGSSSNPSADPELDLIDDLEDGDLKILPNSGRVGYWYTYDDASAARPLASAPSTSVGRMAIHATGSHAGGITADKAYGGLGVELNNANSTPPIPQGAQRHTFDASQWDGFQFYVRAGSSGTKSVRFEIVTTAIAAKGADGGSCEQGDKCWDAFGKDVALSDEWKLIKVPFSQVVQEGWGAVMSFDPSTILGLAFEDRTVNAWDFWVDDLALYKDPEIVDGGGSTDPGGSNECSDEWGGYSSGSITKYWFTQGTTAFGDINCSYGISSLGTSAGGDTVNGAQGNGHYFGAMNTADYDTAAACGACVELTTDIGTSVTLTIVDQCPIGSNPLCVPGHIDLSVDAYNKLNLPVGHYGKGASQGSLSWKYVPCPSTGAVTFRLKEPGNQYWNMVLVENHSYPIAKVEVNTARGWLAASREEYNYWLPPGGNMGTYEVRATDINGNPVTATLNYNKSGAQNADGNDQFECQ